MKCPECGNEDAQQLLVAILCSKIEETDAKVASLEEQMISKLKEMKEILDKKQVKSDSQLQMELAITQMQKSNEQKMWQDRAYMEMEKIRYVSVMDTKTFKITRKLAEEALNKVKTEDPLDAAMKEYLQRKLQIGMIKDITMDD